MSARHRCACGHDAIDVVRVASEDGLLLIPVCADCISEVSDAAGEEQRDLFELSERRRPPTAMPARDDDRQPRLPLRDLTDVEEEGAA
jgi:hypothetical protein